MKRHFLSIKQEQKIVKAIRKAELKTSGEIRVHICFEPNSNHFDQAVAVFNALKMDETAAQNAVLFHVSPPDKNLTIIGGKGINETVPKDFWDKVYKKVARKFKKRKYKKGLIKGISMCGDELKKYYPRSADDKNELPDEISWS